MEGPEDVGEKGDDPLEEEVEEQDATGAAQEPIGDHRHPSRRRLGGGVAIPCDSMVQRVVIRYQGEGCPLDIYWYTSNQMQKSISQSIEQVMAE